MPRLLLLLVLLASVPLADAQQRTPAADEPTLQAPSQRGAADRSRQIVADGSFEAGRVFTFWEQQSFQFSTPLCTVALCDADMNADAVPRTGDWFAWFGGGDVNFLENSLVSQIVSIPAATATLTFWLKMPELDLPRREGVLEVSLGDTAGLNTDSTLVRLTYDDQPDYGEYTRVILPIRSTGVPQRLSFRYTSSENGVSFFVDDISIVRPVRSGLAVVAQNVLAVGDAQLGEVTVGTVPVRNLGGRPLIISGVQYDGDPGLSVGPLPGPIAPGDVGLVEVRIEPDALGAFGGELTIESNGPPETVGVTWDAVSTAVQSFCAAESIDLPALGTLTGPASPYPSTLAVSGLTGEVVDVDVRLVGLSHGLVQSLDLFVQHPEGATSFVMSDVGAASTLSDVTLILDDEAETSLPFSLPFGASIAPGRYRPTNFVNVDGPFAPPAPPAGTVPAAPSLAAFDGLGPNGDWKLWGDIDFLLFANEVGRLSDWCLDIETTNTVDEASAAASLGAEAAAPVGALTVAPNPARGASTVRLVPERTGTMQVALYDVTGRRVQELHDGPVEAGAPLALTFDVAGLPSGVYVVRAVGAGEALGARVTVVR